MGPRRLVCRESSLDFSFSDSYHPWVYFPFTNSISSAYTLLRLCVCFRIALPDVGSALSFTGNLYFRVSSLNLYYRPFSGYGKFWGEGRFRAYQARAVFAQVWWFCLFTRLVYDLGLILALFPPSDLFVE